MISRYFFLSDDYVYRYEFDILSDEVLSLFCIFSHVRDTKIKILYDLSV